MVAVDDLLGQCYFKDVLKNDKAGLMWLLGTPYAQGLKAEALKRLPQYQAVSQQDFISRKYAEYIKLL